MNDNRAIESAVAQTLERGPARIRRAPSVHTFTIVLMVVFFLVMMISLVAGAQMYRNVSTMQARESTLHMQSGLLAGIVRMNDSADAVAKAAGPEGDALVLVERLESGTYETRVYRYQGNIVQEYGIAGHEINPENAIDVMESGRFEFSYQDGLLSVVTDAGTSHVALRSVQEGGPVASSGYTADDESAGGAR